MLGGRSDDDATGRFMRFVGVFELGFYCLTIVIVTESKAAPLKNWTVPTTVVALVNLPENMTEPASVAPPPMALGYMAIDHAVISVCGVAQ
jgi:hypothetical protein